MFSKRHSRKAPIQDEVCHTALHNVLLVIYSPVWGVYADPKFTDSLYKPFFKHRVYAADPNQCTQCKYQLAPTGTPYLLIDSRTKSDVGPEYGWAAHRALLSSIDRFKGYSGYLYLSDDVGLNITSLLNTMKLDMFLSVLNFGICSREVHGVYKPSHSFKRYSANFDCSVGKLEKNYSTFSVNMKSHGLPAHAHCQSNNPDIFYLPARLEQRWSRIANMMEECGLPFTLMHAAAVGVASPNDFKFCAEGKYGEKSNRGCFQHPLKMSNIQNRRIILKILQRDLDLMCPSMSENWMSVAKQASTCFLKSGTEREEGTC